MRLRLAVLASLLMLGALASSASAEPAAAPEHCYGFPGFSSPALTAWAFLHAAVARGGLDAAYTLTTPGFRHGLDCAQWLRRPGVAPFRPIDYKRSQIAVASSTLFRIVYDVHLVGGGRRGDYQMVLTRPQVIGLWRVAVWRARGPAALL